MFRGLRFELNILHRYISLLAGISFLSAFGGVLLWVNGSAAPIVFRATNMPSIAPGFTACFLIWLLIYGLSGMKIGCTLLSTAIYRYKSLVCVTAEIIVYIMLLAWYPLFFSVVHTFFAVVVLSIAVVIQICLLFSHYKRFFICVPLTIIQIFLETYFILITIMYMAIN